MYDGKFQVRFLSGGRNLTWRTAPGPTKRRLGMRATPALDRLTDEVRSKFPSHVTRPEFREAIKSRKVPQLTDRAHVRLRRGGARVDALIRELHLIERGYSHSGEATRRWAIEPAAAKASVDGSTAAALLAIVGDVEIEVWQIVSDVLASYADAEVGAVLIELYHYGYAEFEPGGPTEESDYTANDEFPKRYETPHQYLDDFVGFAVCARLIKHFGRELLLTWIEAVRQAA